MGIYKIGFRVLSASCPRPSGRAILRGVHGDLADKTPHRARKNHVDPVIATKTL